MRSSDKCVSDSVKLFTGPVVDFVLFYFTAVTLSEAERAMQTQLRDCIPISGPSLLGPSTT